MAELFYNTIDLNPAQLAIESEKALGLQTMIQNVFTANPTQEISGFQMKHYLEGKLFKKVNINSVRRSMSNLKNDKVIIKTVKMRIGDEGKPEHLYMLREGNEDKENKKEEFKAAEHALNLIETSLSKSVSKKIHLEFIDDEKDDIPSGVGGGYGFKDILGC